MQNIIYFFAALVLVTGLFIMLTSDNYLRKIIGIGIFQSSVLLFYISLGKVSGAFLPIDICPNSANCPYNISSPPPHLLMLTAILVGFSTMSVGLALIYKIYKEYGTISESAITQQEDN